MGGRQHRRDSSNDGEVWARITGHRSSYYISRDEFADDRVDDEAQLEILATIDAITGSQRKHIGEEMVVSLLAASKYEPGAAATSFFGSVSLRGSQRSALAYLPPTPFWALRELVRGHDTWICIGWMSLTRGYARLSSVFIGEAEDRTRFLELGGNSLVTA